MNTWSHTRSALRCGSSGSGLSEATPEGVFFAGGASSFSTMGGFFGGGDSSAGASSLDFFGGASSSSGTSSLDFLGGDACWPCSRATGGQANPDKQTSVPTTHTRGS